MLKNSLFQPSLSFSFSAAVLFLFLFSTFFCFSAAPLFLFLPAFLFFSVHVCPFFSAQKHYFQPKTILSLAQKHFFSPNVFQPKRFSIFQPKRFCFSSATLLFFFFLLYSFLVQPSFFSFSASFFSFL